MENNCRVIDEENPKSGFTAFITELESLLLKYNATIHNPLGAINVNINGHIFRPYHYEKDIFLDTLPRRSQDVLMRYIGTTEVLNEALKSEFQDQDSPSPLGDDNV